MFHATVAHGGAFSLSRDFPILIRSRDISNLLHLGILAALYGLVRRVPVYEVALEAVRRPGAALVSCSDYIHQCRLARADVTSLSHLVEADSDCVHSDG